MDSYTLGWSFKFIKFNVLRSKIDLHLFGFGARNNLFVEGQRGPNHNLLHCLFFYQGMQCLLQVVVVEGIGISADYQGRPCQRGSHLKG